MADTQVDSSIYGSWHEEVGPIGYEIPFVSAICVTRNRRAMLERSIEMWKAQDYGGQKELIIANDQDVDSIDDLASDDIKVVNFPKCQIGRKRNLAIGQSHGSILVTWDDDDMQGPQRISQQVTRLMSGDFVLTGYNRFQAWREGDAEPGWVFEGTQDYSCGAGLCFTREFWAAHQFEDMQIGEDNCLISAANALTRMVNFQFNKKVIFVAAEPSEFIVGVHRGGTNGTFNKLSLGPWRKL